MSRGQRATAVAAVITLLSAVLVVALARPSGALGEACSDGIDNDGDQKIDFPADPGCASPTDESEGPTCSPVSEVVVCLAPGSFFQRFQAIVATPLPSGLNVYVAGWIDQYQFTVAGVTTTLPCVGLAVDGVGANPCALAGGTFVTRVATLLDQTVDVPAIQAVPVFAIDVCNAELTVTAAGNGINSAPAYAPCQPEVDPGGLIPTGGAQNDCGTGGDAGGSHASASSISLPQSDCSASLPSGDEDWYQFSVTSGQAIDASMTPNAISDFDICIYNPSGTLVAGCTTGSAAMTDSLTHTASTTGNYRLRVKIGSGSGSYTMAVLAGAPAQNDCGTGGDAGGSHAAASLILLPQSDCSGSLVMPTDWEDWYQFPVISGEVISASMTPNASSDFDVCLYDPIGNQVRCSTAGTGSTESISHTALASGNWRFRVYIWSGTGSYTMSVSAQGGGIGVPGPCLPTQTCAREQLRMSLIETTK